MRDNGNNPFTSKGCTGSIRQSESAGTNNRGHFFRGKIQLQGHGTVVVCAAAALHPKKDGLSGSKRRGEAGDDPRTATARTGPRVPHGQRAGEPGQHGEESLGQTFSGFGHHNHRHH